MQGTWVLSLNWEDPLEEGMVAHSSVDWRIPTDRGAWWATVHGVKRVGHDWMTKHTRFHWETNDLQVPGGPKSLGSRRWFCHQRQELPQIRHKIRGSSCGHGFGEKQKQSTRKEYTKLLSLEVGRKLELTSDDLPKATRASNYWKQPYLDFLCTRESFQSQFFQYPWKGSGMLAIGPPTPFHSTTTEVKVLHPRCLGRKVQSVLLKPLKSFIYFWVCFISTSRTYLVGS